MSLNFYLKKIIFNIFWLKFLTVCRRCQWIYFENIDIGFSSADNSCWPLFHINHYLYNWSSADRHRLYFTNTWEVFLPVKTPVIKQLSSVDCWYRWKFTDAKICIKIRVLYNSHMNTFGYIRQGYNVRRDKFVCA